MIKKHCYMTMFLFFFTIFLFLHTLSFSFLADWDDNQLLLNNAIIQTPSFTNFWKILNPLSNRRPLGDEYLPIRDIVSTFNFYLYQKNPGGHRFCNIALHTANVILVYIIVWQLFSHLSFALISALFFAVHPIHIESVVWISSLKDVLSAFFVFLALLLYILGRKNKPRCYFLSVICYALACASKSTAIILPLLLLLLDIYFFKRKTSKKLFFIYTLILFVFLTIAITVSKKQGVVQGYLGEDFFITFKTMCWITTEYIRLSFVPVLQQIPYPYSYTSPYLWVTKWSDAKFLISIVFLFFIMSSLITILIKLLQNKITPYSFKYVFSLAGLWFVIAALPFSNLVPIPEIMAERYLYLPSFAICIFLASPFYLSKSPYLLLFSSLFFVLFLYLFIQRSGDWKNSETLWQATIRNNPKNAKGYYKLAWLYTIGSRQGLKHSKTKEGLQKLRARGISLLQKAIVIDPKYDSALNNLAFLYLESHQPIKAINAIRSAYILHPQLPEFKNNLEYIYDRAARSYGKSTMALKIYLQGQKLYPQSKLFKKKIQLLQKNK